MSNFSIRVGTMMDVNAIVRVTNDAFMADTFFKKPEYFNRFTSSDVEELMNLENSKFLVAVESATGNIIGSILLQWKHHNNELTGKFSAVSVPSSHGKKGIGKLMVLDAERYLLSHQMLGERVVMEMGVINQRADLFPWYEKQGYSIVGEIRPNDPEIQRIVRDDMDIFCILMRKVLTEN